jgi:DHA1 family bicyclomycin/chloramphenicol resistance-like MFS transporter
MARAAAPPRLLTLILLSGLSVGSLNLFVPSLSHIAAEFRAEYGLVNLAVAGYAAATAALLLIMGPLSDRYGRRPVILAGLVIFCIGSLGCLLARDVWTFLAFRMVQAVIISGWAVTLAVIRDTARPERAASLIGYVTMAWAMAPMLGPVLGGALDALFGWRASFWAMLGFGGAILALCWTDLGETNRARSATFGEQLRAYPELVRSRRFWGYALCMAFSVGAFYAFLGGAPLVAATLFGVAPAELGLYVGSITAGFAFGSFLSGRLAGRFALTTMMIAGRLVACAGLAAGLGLLAAGFLHVALVFGACIFVGIGNGLTLPSGNAGAMSVRPALAGSAAGLAGALAVSGGAVISALTGAALGGAVVPEAKLAHALLGIMLLCALSGLAAALYVARLDRADPVAPPGG